MDRTPVSAATLDALIVQVAQQIVQKHLISVLVIGAVGPMPDEPTQFGSEFGDKFSAALAKQSKEFQVQERGKLREFVKKNGLSDVMVVSDGLANWIATKARAEGYVVVEFTRVASGGAEVLVTVYRTDKEDGYFLSSANTTIDLTYEQFTDGLRPIDSDWNKLGYDSKETEQHPLPRGVMPTCVKCARPEPTDLASKTGGYHETVVLAVTISSEATAGDIAVIKSARFGLNARAIDAILKWTFTPSINADGKATPFRIKIEITSSTF